MRPRLLFLSCLVLMLGALPIAAQSDDDPATIIADAYANLQSLDSYYAETESRAEQTITADTDEGPYEGIFVLDVTTFTDVNPRTTSVQGINDGLVTSTENGNTQVSPNQYGFVLIGRDIWLADINEANEVIGEYDPAFDIGVSPSMPNFQQVSEPFSLLYYVSPETILSAEEGASTELDGQTMRVFTVSLDPDALIANGIVTDSGFGEGTNYNIVYSIGDRTMTDRTFDYTMTVWVGVDDSLPHFTSFTFNNTVTAEGNVNVTQVIKGDTTFSNFNSGVLISNPLTSASSSDSGPLTSDAAALVADVVTARDALNSLQSYRVVNDVFAEQTVGDDINEIYLSIEVDSDYQVIPTEAPAPSQGTSVIALIQDQNGSVQNINAIVDSIYVDDTVYSRVVEGDLGVEPGVWVSEAAQVDPIIPELYSTTESFSFFYLIAPDTVTAAVERDPETLDGQTMRVIQVDMDIEELIARGVMTNLDIGVEGGFNLTASFTGNTMLDVDQVYTLEVLIGEDDGLPHQVRAAYSNIMDAGEAGNGEQAISILTTFSEFDAPLTIVAPE